MGLSLLHFSVSLESLRPDIYPHPRFGIINAMDKPELIIIESWEGLPLKGGCSACPDVIFDAGVFIGNEHQQGITLRSMFEVHYREKHASPEESYPSKDRKRAPFTESTPIEAVTEEGGEEIKHWLELADAALNNEDRAA